MTAMLWLSIGITIGTVNGLMLCWTISRLRPDAGLTGMPLVTAGVLLRLGLSAALLVLALRRGIVAGLLAFAGLWLARYILIAATLSPTLLVRLRRS